MMTKNEFAAALGVKTSVVTGLLAAGTIDKAVKTKKDGSIVINKDRAFKALAKVDLTGRRGRKPAWLSAVGHPLAS